MRVALDAAPDASAWEGLGPQEREHRKWVLDKIRRRIAEDGPRRAQASSDRERLFMLFAALEGYGEMIPRLRQNRERFPCADYQR